MITYQKNSSRRPSIYKKTQIKWISSNDFRSLKNNGKYNMQSWELIVLLLSKCAGYHPKYSKNAIDDMGILESQRVMSQVTETIRTAFLGT